MGMKNEQEVKIADDSAFSFRSVFDVLLDNLQKSRMVTRSASLYFFQLTSNCATQLANSQQVHLYRIVYVGEHDSQQLDDLEHFFTKCAAQINFKSGDTQDVLCALLIYYAKHFILMLEVKQKEKGKGKGIFYPTKMMASRFL